MKLYHGSNVVVKNPDLNYSNRARDFGSGFYLTSSLEQAASWARHRTYLSKTGKPTITVFELDDNYVNNLLVKKYDSASKEWLVFITKNRTNAESIKNDYDIIIGPVANDNTTPVINLYLSKIIDFEVAIKELKTYVLKDQYVIKTEESLKFLKYEGVIYD